MQKVIHRAETRGRSDHGWLQSRFSFSFAEWHEPSRMGFGKLRVINDDIIAPLGKFGMHPHKDFEIITIPLSGMVTHEDSLGNTGVVAAGEVQVMSAGTGVVHSEYNASASESLKLFQIWIEPNVKGATPRYAQKSFGQQARVNTWQLLVAEDGIAGTLPIYQNARLARTDLDAGISLEYRVVHKGNGIYVLVIEGEVEAEGESLYPRDAIGISETDSVSISANSPSSLLLFEVPL